MPSPATRRKRHGTRPKRPRVQVIVQTISLALFLWLLWLAAFPVSRIVEAGLPPDFFLWLDPSLTLTAWIAGRNMLAVLITTGVVLLLTTLLGRLFCGYVCPLGITIDRTEDLFLASRASRVGAPARRWKYVTLLILLVAALLGTSLAWLGSPLSLATRFYGLVIFPAFADTAEISLTLLRPLANALDWRWLAFADVATPVYATGLFTLVYVGLLLGLSYFAPRLWCRALCPAGALFALAAGSSRWARKVSDDCTDCGQCARSCPMAAIGQDPKVTALRECIGCRTCQEICPVDAITFPWPRETKSAQPPVPIVPARREALAAIATGAFLGVMAAPGALRALGETSVPPRPPGSLPEIDFLARCVRCGECVKACPGNTLQPAWLTAGLPGLLAPQAQGVSGPCLPDCALCGQVCPTGAIRPLAVEEKTWARPGTAQVDRKLCLAWEKKQACLVCDEVCPYGAVSLARVPQSPVGVPVVDEKRCAGCAACEFHCPTRPDRAIVVTSKGAIRPLEGVSALGMAREQGLDISRKKQKGYAGADQGGMENPFDDLPPGFDQ